MVLVMMLVLMVVVIFRAVFFITVDQRFTSIGLIAFFFEAGLKYESEGRKHFSDGRILERIHLLNDLPSHRDLLCVDDLWLVISLSSSGLCSLKESIFRHCSCAKI